MSVLYTFDADLDTVLQAASNEDLDPLVEFIQQAQISENLTSSPEFKRFFPDHQRYVHIISHDLRAFGGHAVANLFRRGRGPNYRAVVCDVAKHFKLQFDEEAPLPAIERQLLAHVMKELYGQMTDEQKQLFVSEVQQYQASDTDAQDQKQNFSPIVSTESRDVVVKAIEQANFEALSPKVLTLLSAVVNNTMARVWGTGALITKLGDSLEQSISKLQSIINLPLNWLKQMFNALCELGGPSYRVIVPCVIHIAMLRIKQSSNLLAYQQPSNAPQLSKDIAPEEQQVKAQEDLQAQEDQHS